MNDTWEKDREKYKEKRRAFTEKKDRIVNDVLECMNKEGILLSEVDIILRGIKAATNRQAEAALKEIVTVKASV